MDASVGPPRYVQKVSEFNIGQVTSLLKPGCMVQALTVINAYLFHSQHQLTMNSEQFFNHPHFTLIATVTSQTAENTMVQVWKVEKSFHKYFTARPAITDTGICCTELHTLACYMEIWGERLRHKLSQIISSEIWLVVYGIATLLPVVVSFVVFSQYVLSIVSDHTVFTGRPNMLMFILRISAVSWVTHHSTPSRFSHNL